MTVFNIFLRKKNKQTKALAGILAFFKKKRKHSLPIFRKTTFCLLSVTENNAGAAV